MNSMLPLGGEFLLREAATTRIFVPEDLAPEQRQMAETAFSVLGEGQLKVAATTKGAFAEAAGHAAGGKQSGRAIGEQGAVRERLADMAASIFVSESVVYRVAGLLDERIATPDRGEDYHKRYQEAIEEYAAECAIAKVFCSDEFDGVVDHAVFQRILEGTKEVNRILIPTTLFCRAESGSIDLWHMVHVAKEKATLAEVAGSDRGGVFALEFALLANLKSLFLLLLGAVAPARESQEILLALADMVVNIFALESAVVRGEQVFATASDEKKGLLQAMVKVVAFERATQFHLAAIRGCGYAGLLNYRTMLRKNIQRLSYYPVEGLLEAKHLLAKTAMEMGRYMF